MDSLHKLKAGLSGRYAIDREIGAGGMATVYLARDLRHDRRVALKVLKPELGAVLGGERFLAEIRVTATLQHPNLLPLFDSGDVDGLLYYVMPFIDGESLRARLDREKQLGVEEATHIATTIADALDYAHRHGVIHRDLKPENLLLHEHQPLIADFGIALAVSNAGGARITQTGLSLGTPQYMSPEQATGDRAIDARTDLYSLAAVLYEMLTGDPPHLGGTAQAVIAKVLIDRPRSVRLARPTVPEHVAAAIDRALEKLPADRFATAHEMSEALRGRAPSIAAGTATAARAGAQASRSRAVPALAALLAITGGLAAWGWLRTPPRATNTPARFVVTLPSDMRVDNQYAPLTMSRDGQFIVFRANVGTGIQLVRRRVDDVDPFPIPNTDGAGFPAMSPDNKWVAFIANDQLRKTSIDGGPSVPIVSTQGYGSGFDWAPNGTIVISGGAGGGVGDRAGRGLSIVPATGGALTRLTTVDSAHGEVAHRWPRVLPDGNTIVYASWSSEGVSAARLGVTTLDGGVAQTLDVVGAFPVGMVEGHLLYVNADGVLLAVPFDMRARKVTGASIVLIEGIDFNAVVGSARIALAASGTLVYLAAATTSQLVSVDMGGIEQPLVAQAGRFVAPIWSPDGRRIAVQQTTSLGRDVWLFELGSTGLTRFTTDGQSHSPAWSPDGRHILFSGVGGALWSKAADGSGAVEKKLEVNAQTIIEAAVAPDSHTVVYRLVPRNNLYAADLVSDAQPIVVADTRYAEAHPAISPLGKWVAYTTEESGAPQVVIRPFPGPGGVTSVSVDGGSEPAWSPDGKQLYYRRGRQVLAATVETSPTVRITARRIVFEGPYVLAGMTAHPSLSVSPDGKRFVMLRGVEDDSRLIVTTHWVDELRARLTVKR